jgi:predicted nuclease of predicted toxin-antitoxin system
VKLLIDEMYPAVIAQRLRQAGHDAIAVTEDAGTIGVDDTTVFDLAVRGRRAVVTENAADFLRIAKQRAAKGDPVPTLVITSNRSFPRHARGFIGRAVRALTSFCAEHPGDDPQAGAVHWRHPLLTAAGADPCDLLVVTPW